MALTAAPKARRRLVVPIAIVLLVIVTAAMIGGLKVHARAIAKNAQRARYPVSRQVLVFQESIVKRLKPAPTLAALQYAYVASAYNDALIVGGQSAAVATAGSTLDMIYPTEAGAIDMAMIGIRETNQLDNKVAAVASILQTYAQRYANDGHTLAWNGVIPKGPGKWVQLSNVSPLTPRAGDWQRWNVTSAISVPAPPVYGSAEDQRQIAIVSQAASNRTGEDVNLINFWGGTPGSETPAGIWQNQLYTTVKADLPATVVSADMKYALLQKYTAQTLSDAFMECWKVKYTYWTARPSMRLPGLVTTMNNPNFPGYISGHSTISKAAADVLSITAPKHAAAWESMAAAARLSRLKAGIHFDVDNAVGFDVGTAVAKQTANKLQLQPVLQ